MKRHPVHTLLCLTPLALTLASCEKVEVIDEAPADGETTTVRILARAASPSDDLYPLRLYAFTNDGTLCSSQTVSAADEKISLSIPQGVETRVVAVTADEATYTIPASPSIDGVITPNAPQLPSDVPDFARTMARGYVTSHPLQAALADLSPSSPTAALSMQLHYQMASVRFTLSGLPASCGKAYVRVASPYEALALSGELTGSQKSVVPLTRSAEGRWVSNEAFLFPTTGAQTVFTIAYEDDAEKQYAQVTYQAPLRAGVPYELNGTLSGGTLEVTGSVTPAQWGTPESLSFTSPPMSRPLLEAQALATLPMRWKPFPPRSRSGTAMSSSIPPCVATTAVPSCYSPSPTMTVSPPPSMPRPQAWPPVWLPTTKRAPSPPGASPPKTKPASCALPTLPIPIPSKTCSPSLVATL